MQAHVVSIVAVTSSDILRYAAAFFFVLVAIGIAYACLRVAKALARVDIVMADIDREAVPLMKKTGVTLDNVNANLGNVDEITKDVADITDKIDTMANAVEGAVTKPARKAAAFGAGVQTAVSSFMRRERDTSESEPGQWPAGESAASAATADASAEEKDEPVTSAFTGTTFTGRSGGGTREDTATAGAGDSPPSSEV